MPGALTSGAGGPLEAILKEPVGKGVLDFTPIHAATALERRRGAAHFDLALARLLRTEDTFAAQELLSVVTAMGQQATADQRGRLAGFLRGHLKETNLMMSEICQEIWASDLRELKPDLERLATAGPEAEESDRADTAGGPIQPVRGTFHRARQVAQVWGEEDPVTHAKLLVAMALHEAYLYVEESHPALRRRFDQALATTAKELSADQKKEVTAFATAFAPKSTDSSSASLAEIVKEALK